MRWRYKTTVTNRASRATALQWKLACDKYRVVSVQEDSGATGGGESAGGYLVERSASNPCSRNSSSLTAQLSSNLSGKISDPLIGCRTNRCLTLL